MLADSVTNYNHRPGISFGALPKKYKKVDNYLIRGPHPNISDIFQLKKEGVNQIYDFRHYGYRGFKFAERLACKFAGIKYNRKPFSFLEGKYPALADYETVSKSVKENGEKGGKTLFHCNSGTHRTALMSAFYDITKGNPIETCRAESDYEQKVNQSVEKHILNSKFFSRNKVVQSTNNPVLLLKNGFNNKVVNATRKAYNLFFEILGVPSK